MSETEGNGTLLSVDGIKKDGQPCTFSVQNRPLDTHQKSPQNIVLQYNFPCVKKLCGAQLSAGDF